MDDYKLIIFWIVTAFTICIFFVVDYLNSKESEYSEYLAFSVSITYYILQLAAISGNKNYFISVLVASLSIFILAIIRIGKSSKKLFKALVASMVIILASTAALLIYVDPKHIPEFLISLFLSIIFAILGIGFEKRNLSK